MLYMIALLKVYSNSLDIDNFAYHCLMENIRVVNVKGLIASERFGGNQAEFARAIGKSSAQVNQWLTGHRNIGDGSAANIEEALDLPRRYLDQVHNEYAAAENPGGNTNNPSTVKEPQTPYSINTAATAATVAPLASLAGIFAGLDALLSLPAAVPIAVLAAVLRDAKTRAAEELSKNPAKETKPDLPENWGSPNYRNAEVAPNKKVDSPSLFGQEPGKKTPSDN